MKPVITVKRIVGRRMLRGALTGTLLGALLLDVSGSASASERASAETGRTDVIAGHQAGTNAAKTRFEVVLVQMRELDAARKWGELIRQFKDEDMAAWPVAFVRDAVEAAKLRGKAYVNTKDYERAEKDLMTALHLAPNGYSCSALANFYQVSLKDNQRALDAYNKAFELDLASNEGQKTYGWMPVTATLEAASILVEQGKYAEALHVMERYDDREIQKMPPFFVIRTLRMYGRIYANQGRESESLAKFKQAVELEQK